MKRLHLLIPFVLLLLATALFNALSCSEEIVDVGNSGPIIDSIITDPLWINPGSEIVLKAFATDPDGDSISYSWSTYYLAGFFSDSMAPLCTMLVNKVLDGGMKMKVDLTVDDGQDRSTDSIWIDLVPGEYMSGFVYHNNTQIPAGGVVVGIRKNIDTTNLRGFFELNNISGGEAVLVAQSQYCNPDSFDIVVYDSLEYSLHIECPDLTKSISGELITESGEPLENVEILALNKDSSATDLADTTDAFGRFAIDNLPLGNRLLAITEIENTVYDILPETLSFSIIDSTEISLLGHVKRTLFSFNGIDDSSMWNLDGSGNWNTWTINSEDNCISYNSCSIPGLTELLMAVPIAVPDNAVKVGWRADIDLENVICYLTYQINGVDDNGYSFPADASGEVFENIVQTSYLNPIGSNFEISFYGLPLDGVDCSSACLKRLEIFYYE